MLDQTDWRILDELSANSRLTMKELGEKVHLTGPAVTARVAKLEDQGIIEGYSIKINSDKLGYPLHAFLTIITYNIHHQPYLSFIETKDDFVLHNYKTSGEGCYLLECRFPSNEVMNTFLEELNEYANYKLTLVIDG